MSKPIEVVAYHGWGFDRTCWQPWEERLTQQGFRFQAFDRGYFGLPLHPVCAERFQIILTHSHGLHLCPIAQLQQADLLVIFSSFLEFHPSLQRARGRSQTMLDQMLKQFRNNPEAVLKHFKTRCYFPFSWEALPSEVQRCKTCSSELLIQDLEDLGSSCLEIDALTKIPNVLVLQGTKDRIIASSKGQEISQALHSRGQYFEIPEAGHALPFTHFQACWSVLTHASQLFNSRFNS